MKRFRVATTVIATMALGFAVNAASASAQGVGFTYAPQSLSFGKQKVDTKSNAKTVTLTAICGPDYDGSPAPGFQPAPGPCSLTDIAISGDFLISSMTCPQTGFFGQSGTKCAINVKFKPKAKGKREGFLRINSNPFQGVPLDGKGCKKKVDGVLKQCNAN